MRALPRVASINVEGRSIRDIAVLTTEAITRFSFPGQVEALEHPPRAGIERPITIQIVATVLPASAIIIIRE